MSNENTSAATEETTTQTNSESLLTQAIQATKHTAPDRAKELLTAFTTAAMDGVITWDKNLTQTVHRAITEIDAKISKQLSFVMHAPDFKQLEGSWRGLHYLVKNTLCSNELKIKIFNAKKTELLKDFNKALDFDQTELFKKIYEQEFGTSGGEPYAVLIGDYEFSNHADDMDLLDNISHIAAAAFCPFISAANPGMMGLETWHDLAKPRDLAKIFEAPEFIRWRGIREAEDSRFVSLVMPRVLARLPYGKATKTIAEFAYEEVDSDENGKAEVLAHEDYCWMNAAYVKAVRINTAYADYGWCTAIRGAENGGKVTGLPTHFFMSDDGDTDMKCPTEIGITDRREAELSKLGFLPLCHYKNTDYAVFFGAQTIQKPKQYDQADATANAVISARLPYIMATSRFAHFLKIMARDKVGSFMELTEMSQWLNGWIINYVNGNPNCGAILKAKYPLSEAQVKVEEVPGQPGSYHAIAWLRPWLQLEELTTSIRMVAKIPKIA
jgi:type VI secretion system protein ImpC